MKKAIVITIKLIAAAFLLRIYWRWLKYGKSTVGPVMRGHGRIGGRTDFVDDSEIVRRRMAWQSIPQLFRWLTPPILRYLWDNPKIQGDREFHYWRDPKPFRRVKDPGIKMPSEEELKLKFPFDDGCPSNQQHSQARQVDQKGHCYGPQYQEPK